MGESSVLYADLILLKSILLCFTPLLPAPPKNQSTLAVHCILLVYLKLFSIILILIQERHITNLFHMFLGQGKNNSLFAHKLARQKSSSPLHVLAFLLYSLILHPSSPYSSSSFLHLHHCYLSSLSHPRYQQSQFLLQYAGSPVFKGIGMICYQLLQKGGRTQVYRKRVAGYGH